MRIARPLLLLLLLLTGCATLPPGQDIIGNLSQDNPVPLAAVELSSDSPLLGEKPVKGKLGSDAPVVKLAQGNSYYRLFRLRPANGTLHLEVTAYCTCLGFDKRMVVPLVRVLTKSGQVVSPLPDGYEYSLKGPFEYTLNVTVPGAHAAYALVAADNSRPDAPISGVNINGALQLDVRAYPVGRFDVRYIGP